MSAPVWRGTASDGLARAGRAEVRGRAFSTPAFMPVGTAGTVKGLAPWDLVREGCEIILANTYHLHLRPGAETVRSLGGLHRFMGFHGAILTDSGGYQIFSHQDRVAVDDDSVTFRSHVDGSRVRLTPETVIDVQRDLDPDIAMVLDQPVALPAPPEDVALAARRTLLWARRCLDRHRATVRSGQLLFGIVQGALDSGLRARQVDELASMGFDGLALGGLAVGETREERAEVLMSTLPRMPSGGLRYVMGIGYPEDILEAIACGADLFDCVLPTRHARTGQAFTSRGIVRLRHKSERGSAEALDPDCPCRTCSTFSRGYLSHLYHSREMLGPILVTLHNVSFYQRLVRGARDAIREGRFEAFRREFFRRYAARES